MYKKDVFNYVRNIIDLNGFFDPSFVELIKNVNKTIININFPSRATIYQVKRIKVLLKS